MKKKNALGFLIICGISAIALLAFTETPLSDEEKIQWEVEQQIKAFHERQQNQCKQKALNVAIPIVDSLIAELYAKDLRARDFILERPEKPEMPDVEIKPFPLDSIEKK